MSGDGFAFVPLASRRLLRPRELVTAKIVDGARRK
jgi:hypothetical protein